MLETVFEFLPIVAVIIYVVLSLVIKQLARHKMYKRAERNLR